MPDLSELSDEQLLALIPQPATEAPDPFSFSAPRTEPSPRELSSLSDEELFALDIKPGASLYNEAAAVKNRGVEGTAGLIDFIGSASRNLNPLQLGGPALFGLNDNIMNRPPPSVTEGAKSIGLIGEETPQTSLGKIAGEVAYYAPDFLLPGGLTKAGIASTLGAGTAAGVTKAVGGGEGAQAIAGLAGALSPTALQVGRNVISKTMGKTLQDQGAAMRRKAIGTRQGDYTRSAKDLSIYDVTSGDLPKTTRIDDLPPETVAKAMQEAFDDAGFAPETYYHGTPDVFDQLGAKQTDSTLGRGTYITTDPGLANEFTQRYGGLPRDFKEGVAKPNMWKVRARTQNAFSFDDIEPSRLPDVAIQAKAVQKGEQLSATEKQNIVQAFNNTDEYLKKTGQPWDNRAKQLLMMDEFGLLPEDVAKGLGKTGVAVRSAPDEYAMFSPEDIRSTFDPPQKEFQAALKRYADELDPLPGTSADEVTEAGAETLSKRVFDRIIESGELGNSRDPSKLLETALKKGRKASSDVASAVQAAAKGQKQPIDVAFTRAQDYLDNGYAAANETPRLEAELEKLAESIRTRGKGKLDFIHRQKIAYGQKYSLPEFAGSKGFYKALYHDLMKAVEDHVPGIKEMNKDVRDWNYIVTPVLKRSLGISENATLDAETLKRIRTSGGVGSLIVPSVAGGSAGFVLGPLAGLSTAAAVSFANSAPGREVIGRTLQNLGKGTKITTENLPVVLDALQKAASEQGINLSAEEQQSKAPIGALSQPSKQPAGFLSAPGNQAGAMYNPSGGNGMKKTPVAAIEAQIDQDPIDAAIYEVESGRNPKAKNPNSSAAGGFQLIKATAKALGVKDPYDLAQNYEGYKKLRAENERALGSDPSTIYAGHFLGMPLAKKWLSGAKLTAEEAGLVRELETKALPRFERIYSRIVSDQGVAV